MDAVADEELVRRFQGGDGRALAVLVQRHQDRLYRLAHLWLYDTTEADDVVQEVFSRSYEGLMRFRFKSQTSTWLIRVGKNVCREFNRRRRGETLHPDMEGTFEDNHEQADTIAAVRRMLGRLPPRQKEVVALRFFEELSVTETAHVMGCREGTVKALTHKATARLRELEEASR